MVVPTTASPHHTRVRCLPVYIRFPGLVRRLDATPPLQLCIRGVDGALRRRPKTVVYGTMQESPFSVREFSGRRRHALSMLRHVTASGRSK